MREPTSTTRRAYFSDLTAIIIGLIVGVPASGWHFTEIAGRSGLDYEHGFGSDPITEPHLVSGGVAAGDFDADGRIDLYVVRGSLGPNLLFRNVSAARGVDFQEIGESAGLALEGGKTVGPTFGDLDGDGWLDLVIGGIAGAGPRVFLNRGDRTFEEITATSGIFSTLDSFSTALGDVDRDGDLDMFLTHWSPAGSDPIGAPHLWRNDTDSSGRGSPGPVTFNPIDFAAGIAPTYENQDWSFTPTMTDFDADGWPDLAIASDFGTSTIFHNRSALSGSISFEALAIPAITDENGMGSAVADYDNDGDLDWFVSSIWDPDGTATGNWGVTGNRLYRNTGNLEFEDATDEAGVRHGYWGWGSCFGDFDNDGDLDLFHTNGFQAPGASEFHFDPARMFLSNSSAGGIVSFDESSTELGLDDLGQGRGVVCFDVDRDGDLDIFVANNGGPPLLYRNDGGNSGHFVELRLRADSANSEAVGARIRIRAQGAEQLREIRAGSNYVSQNPAEAHFGLGSATMIVELEIRWPDGELTTMSSIPADQILTVHQVDRPAAVEIPGQSNPAAILLVLLLSLAAVRQLGSNRPQELS